MGCDIPLPWCAVVDGRIQSMKKALLCWDVAVKLPLWESKLVPGSFPPQISCFKISSIEFPDMSQLFACCCCGKLVMEVDLDVIFLALLVAKLHWLLLPPLVGCLIVAGQGPLGKHALGQSKLLNIDSNLPLWHQCQNIKVPPVGLPHSGRCRHQMSCPRTLSSCRDLHVVPQSAGPILGYVGLVHKICDYRLTTLGFSKQLVHSPVELWLHGKTSSCHPIKTGMVPTESP